MRENFEQNLNTYTETIKESLKDLSKEGKIKSEEIRTEVIEQASASTHTTPEAEATIYSIQKSKLEKLNKFKKFLGKTRSEDGGFVHPEQQPSLSKVSADKEGNFFITTASGALQKTTLGEIMTDYEWGIEYSFDPSVDIHDIRKYTLEKLKSELRDKLDTQIITSELANTRADTFKQNAYQKIAERSVVESEQQGVIAEKMVKNFLKKLAIDTNADFEIIEADAYQDVEQKIDFIVHRKTAGHVRGAKVEESETATDIGVQFTTAIGKTEHKEHQITQSKKRLTDVDDLVLVTMPAHDASFLYNMWKKQKTSGGPEKMWSTEIQESVFRGVMDKVLTKEEIDQFCTKHF